MDLEEFKKLNDVEIVPVEVKGGVLHVRTMENDHGDEFEQVAVNARKKGEYAGVKSALLCRTLCDESGTLLFAGQDEEAAFASIKQRSSATVQALFQAALRLNGLADDIEADKDAKN